MITIAAPVLISLSLFFKIPHVRTQLHYSFYIEYMGKLTWADSDENGEYLLLAFYWFVNVSLLSHSFVVSLPKLTFHSYTGSYLQSVSF